MSSSDTSFGSDYSDEHPQKEEVMRLPPRSYIHVLDNNTHCRRVVVGPATFTRQEHEKVLFRKHRQMIVLPPEHFVSITNPAQRDEHGNVVMDDYGQVKIRLGDREIRTAQDCPTPFPLYPGETADTVKPLRIVGAGEALVLQAERPFVHQDKKYETGEEWLFKGPATYIPHVEVKIKSSIQALIIKSGKALKLRAIRECVDSLGMKRKSGEEWLIREEGEYLPSVDEEALCVVHAHVLVPEVALHLRALKTFTDVYGQKHKAGEEWLVTSDISESHICDVFEVEVGTQKLHSLTDRQFCVVEDPYIDEEQRLGACILCTGPCNFFLRPGESLRNGIQGVYILEEHDALLLRNTEGFVDSTSPDILRIPENSPARKDWKGVDRSPGDLWMVYGPCEFVPDVRVEVVEKRRSIALNESEGIYVRDTQTGKIRAIVGRTYMLAPREVLWEKPLSSEVEKILQKQGSVLKRDRTRVITFPVKAGHIVQIYNYQIKRSRVLIGPSMVILGPEEQFTVMHLSGGTPKVPNRVSVISLRMGPKFMSDQITVETGDHARLRLKLAYNWHFDVDRTDPQAAQCVFTVRDFVGDACKAMASRIRGAVASSTFDNFHKHSATLIRLAVMGRDNSVKSNAKGDTPIRPRDRLVFAQNKLVITNVDVQSVEPVDDQTRESLQKSVTLAIQITTKSQEAKSKHQAEQEEEIAKGDLTTQRLLNKKTAEEYRRTLLTRQAESRAIAAQGVASAEAKAEAKAQDVANKCAVEIAKLEAQAMNTEMQVDLKIQQARQEAEVKFMKQEADLEVEKNEALGQIETNKFNRIVEAIGPDTLTAIARAGPEMKAKLLQGLGLTGYMVTDGSSPINLFKTAEGLISADRVV